MNYWSPIRAEAKLDTTTMCNNNSLCQRCSHHTHRLSRDLFSIPILRRKPTDGWLLCVFNWLLFPRSAPSMSCLHLAIFEKGLTGIQLMWHIQQLRKDLAVFCPLYPNFRGIPAKIPPKSWVMLNITPGTNSTWATAICWFIMQHNKLSGGHLAVSHLAPFGAEY